MIRRAHFACVVNPQKASNSRALRVKDLLGRFVAIVRHEGGFLSPSGGVVQPSELGWEFTESANTKASNFMRAGVGGTGPVSSSGGFGRALRICQNARV